MGEDVIFEGYLKDVFFGEEVLLEDSFKRVSPYMICDGSAAVDSDTMAVFNIESYHEVYASLLVFPDRLPVVSKKTTKELMADYQKKLSLSYSIGKKLTKELYGKAPYRFSYMNKKSQIIPLEGDVRKAADYINLAYIKSFQKYSSYQVALSFSTFFELVIPIQEKRFNNRCQTYFECFICHAYMDKLINKDDTEFAPFKLWKGDLHKAFPELILKAIERVENSEVIHKRLFYEWAKSAPRHVVEESLDDFYYGDFDL